MLCGTETQDYTHYLPVFDIPIMYLRVRVFRSIIWPVMPAGQFRVPCNIRVWVSDLLQPLQPSIVLYTELESTFLSLFILSLQFTVFGQQKWCQVCEVKMIFLQWWVQRANAIQTCTFQNLPSMETSLKSVLQKYSAVDFAIRANPGPAVSEKQF